MMIDQIKNLSYQMRLYGIHGGAERLAEQAAGESLSHLEYLGLLLEQERLTRRERMSKSLMTRAKFRSSACVSDWDFSTDRGISKGDLRDLGSLGFFHKKENLLILGPTGTGKTHLATALGHRLCEEEIKISFLSTHLFFEELSSEKLAGRYLRFLKKTVSNSVLILDDFGLRKYSHDEATFLIEVLDQKYNKGSIIVTSQVDPKGWVNLFEDPVIAEALVDRIQNPSKMITLKGRSYRSKVGVKNDCKNKKTALDAE